VRKYFGRVGGEFLWSWLVKKSIVFIIAFQGHGLSGNPFFFHCPFSQVNQFATFGAKWFGCLFWKPGHRTPAVGTFYNERFAGRRH